MHGALDVSLAVMSVNKKARRIDLDAGDILYHMKVSYCILLALIEWNVYIFVLKLIWSLVLWKLVFATGVKKKVIVTLFHNSEFISHN